eukprot:TRINITY_DN18369_c0_g1_i1.p1 TRINITY_DN18369_c0_g1~~TRINITY_DN18369_c0_g1_i1.p1  ORF type:complete len:1405 (-),score=316.78 TRINITY_DN18369_c0_g1_i1:316-4530(-)
MASHSRAAQAGGSSGHRGPHVDEPSGGKDSQDDVRNRGQLDPVVPPTSSSGYWSSDDDDGGPKPSELYGKFTWKIESFSEISKRELRSNVFEVGGYKWYILVYPQGCDVCNHLSLFLCVADYDKLLPGWSHFAQFTIAVVNKDPKKSKYSDTLHRFCKKEHDWGWKKFMELSKVLDGFTVQDTLVIKAQVQVIRENPHRPFRCLDCQYRRELVRVYLTNVEGICRRFVEEKKEKLGKLMEDTVRWASFRAFWMQVEESARKQLASEKTDVILKAVVKRFFNEKEVTSTLVMDALYSGCKALDQRSTSNYKGDNARGKGDGFYLDGAGEPSYPPVVLVEQESFVLAGDILAILERAATEALPPYKDDKGAVSQNRTKDGGATDELGKDSVERDERRLAELGRRTVEMFVLAHLFSSRVEVAYREAVALKRQEELIREEEASWQAEFELREKRNQAEREKKKKKQQAKQRRKDRMQKEADEKKAKQEEEQKARQETEQRRKDLRQAVEQEHAAFMAGRRANKPVHISLREEEDDDDDDVDMVVDRSAEAAGPTSEDQDAEEHGVWENEGEDYDHDLRGRLDDGKEDSIMDDAVALDEASSDCSSDSSVSLRTAPVNTRREATQTLYDGEESGPLEDCSSSGAGAASSLGNDAAGDSEAVILSYKDRIRWLEQRLAEKEEEVVMLQTQLSIYQHQEGLNSTFESRGGSHASAAQRPLSGESETWEVVSADEKESSRVASPLSAYEPAESDVRSESLHGKPSTTPLAAGKNGVNGFVTGHGLRDVRQSRQSTGQAASARTQVINGQPGGVLGNGSSAADVSRAAYQSTATRAPQIDSKQGSGVGATCAPLRTKSLDLQSRSVLRVSSVNIQGPQASNSGGGQVTASEEVGPGPVVGNQAAAPATSVAAVNSRLPVAQGSGARAGPAPVVAPTNLGAGVNASQSAHLSRSLSANASASTNSGSMQGMQQSNGPSATPSYRNAAAGRMRSSGQAMQHPGVVGSGMFPVAPTAAIPPQQLGGLSPPMTPSLSVGAPSLLGGSHSQNGALVSDPNALSVSPASNVQSVTSSSAQLETSSGVTGTVGVSGMGVPRERSQENGGLMTHLGQPSATTSGAGSQVGITFGTVTPEILHHQQSSSQHGQAQGMELGRQSQQVSLQLQAQQQVLQQQMGLVSSGQVSMQPLMMSKLRHSPGPYVDTTGLSEDFPHLSLINDLLDEDAGLNMALHMAASGAIPFSMQRGFQSHGHMAPSMMQMGGHKRSHPPPYGVPEGSGSEEGSNHGASGEERGTGDPSGPTSRKDTEYGTGSSNADVSRMAEMHMHAQHHRQAQHMHGQGNGVLRDGSLHGRGPQHFWPGMAGGRGNGTGPVGSSNGGMDMSFVSHQRLHGDGVDGVPPTYVMTHSGYPLYSGQQQ